MAEQLRVGIIGYGQQGAVHAEVWSGIEGAKLAAIAESDPDRAAVALRNHAANGCTLYETGRGMLKKEELDIVIVATQPPSHAILTCAALERGAHVIVEKPMALTLEEADAMVVSAERFGRHLAVHLQTPFADAVRRALELVSDVKTFGELYYMEGWGKGRPAPYDLMEVGVHLLHLMCCFADGEPQDVYGRVTINGRPVRPEDAHPVGKLYLSGRTMGIGAGDCLFGEYHFGVGACGVIRLQTLPEESHNTQFMALELYGTKRRLRFHQTSTGWLFEKPGPHDDLEGTRQGWRYVESEPGWSPDLQWRVPMRRYAEAFLGRIRGDDGPLLASGYDGRMALEMALGIYASHLAGRRLALPLEDRRHPFA